MSAENVIRYPDQDFREAAAGPSRGEDGHGPHARNATQRNAGGSDITGVLASTTSVLLTDPWVSTG
jgi:hypothetical protein